LKRPAFFPVLLFSWVIGISSPPSLPNLRRKTNPRPSLKSSGRKPIPSFTYPLISPHELKRGVDKSYVIEYVFECEGDSDDHLNGEPSKG